MAPKVMLESQGHYGWFPLGAGRRVHVTKEEAGAELKCPSGPTQLSGGCRASPVPCPALTGVLLGQDSSLGCLPSSPWHLRVPSQSGPSPEHDHFSPLSSIKEKLMTQADRFSEEEVSSGF